MLARRPPIARPADIGGRSPRPAATRGPGVGTPAARCAVAALAALLLALALAGCQPAGASTVDVAGERVDADAAELTLAGKQLSAEDLEKVASLPDLRTLELRKCEIADLAPLAGMEGLAELSL